MTEAVEWLPDGTPYSPRFADRYRSESGGLAQAEGVFLAGCQLPSAWAHAPDWKILETGFGLGLNFLVTWQAWKSDPSRPRLLHFISVEAYPANAADLLRAASSHPHLMPLANELAAQFNGLLPGVHRLQFERGHVMLTLCIGPIQDRLSTLRLAVDAVYLDGFSPAKNPDMWSAHALKAVARCCRRGTRLATWTVARAVFDGLRSCGFEVSKVAGVAPKRDQLTAVFNPGWTPKKAPDVLAHWARPPSSCVVIGAGLAGAACAASLARRGWQVQVLDKHAAPAQGTSGLPAGLFAPHVSPDDGLLSRLSRSGVRMSLQEARRLLGSPGEWQHTGVLQRRFDSGSQLPAHWTAEDSCESCVADSTALERLAHAAAPDGIAGDPAPALWHSQGGWIRPASLAKAWLSQPGIRTACGVEVARLLPCATGWQVVGKDGNVVAQAELVVLAAGFESAALHASVPGTSSGLELQSVRGQVTWGVRGDLRTGTGSEARQPSPSAEFPCVPVNGDGNFIPAFDHDGRPHWLMGSTFERSNASVAPTHADQAKNLDRLRHLLPGTAAAIDVQCTNALTAVQAWAGVRCTSPDRLPLVGPLDEAVMPGLWVCTGLGSRGLTFAALCAELLAALVNAEPLPVERRLAQGLLTSRLKKRPGRAI
jgi:tRNA 5-methylaminomethyl-2-thiouridine biosynthesis bifunctional protein